jgi:SAM-dependent methyltransferase
MGRGFGGYDPGTIPEKVDVKVNSEGEIQAGKGERTEVTPCPLCGADEPVPLFWTKDYTFRCSDTAFRLNRCPACDCGYLSPRPAREDIAIYYPAEFYWAWETESQNIDWNSILEKRGPQLAAKYAWLADLLPGRLLDIGAQKGEFLWHMRHKGWDVEGVELDSSVPNPMNMPIRYGDFMEMDFEEGAYDVITFWAVLEHVHEPASFFRKAAKLLRPGGRMTVLVTNLDSIQARWCRSDDYPRHLTIFNRRSVERLCRDAGLRLGRMATDQKIFGGSLHGSLVYLGKRAFGYSIEEAMAEWKQIKDPGLFWHRWRGKPSLPIKTLRYFDRILTWPFEKLLDSMGRGFILTFSAHK